MSSLLEKIEAMEKVGAGDLADQALRKLIHLHLQKYEKQMKEMEGELKPFEKKYGMNSEECYRRFEAGELGDAADIVEWMGLYDNVRLYRERIKTLRAVDKT
jgi:hypothetical protein